MHRGVGGHGVVGVLRSGTSKRAIGLRADMDALDVLETNEFDHKSTIPGKMHACGHDGHTTMLLGAARILCETRDFAGRVAVIFQPAEEGPPAGEDGGAVGFTRRANSALALGAPGLPLDEALRRVVAWYTERGLPAYVQAGPGAGETRELPGELERRGWRREVSAHVLVGALAPLADRLPDPAGVRLGRDVDEAWMTRYQRSDSPAPEVCAVLRGGPSVWFATCPAPRDATAGTDPAPAAIGRLVVDGRWAGFTAVEVAPEFRRRGLASAVMGALARQALDEGASAAYLQVETDNAAALALYEGLGFTVHHTYDHWRAPEEDGS